MVNIRLQVFALLVLAFSFAGANAGEVISSASEDTWSWEMLETEGAPTARHEASAVAYKGKLYLIGGRRINPVDVYDPEKNSWVEKSKTPIELHHFQAVVVDDAIYLMGAMTGGWPNETPLDKVIIYYPETDTFAYSHDIPEGRRRGGAGVVYHNDKIYIVGGIVNGHMNGYVGWMDEYDPKTGEWRVLPDAPHKRDHFSAAVIDNKLYAFAGRQSEHAIGNDFGPTEKDGDVFDFSTESWETTESPELPTTRAGGMVYAFGNKLLIGGGESEHQEPAHSEVEAYDTLTKTWSNWPSLNQGRHGSSFVSIGDYLYTASGCGKRGGEPELASIERLKLPSNLTPTAQKKTEKPKGTEITSDDVKTIEKWHTLTLSIQGPQVSETHTVNPFTDYRLLVEFEGPENTYLVRGFYAADGDAANTSADAGNIWQARFTPDQVGEWRYKANLVRGDNVAVSLDPDLGQMIDIENEAGRFNVVESKATYPDFRAGDRGRLGTDRGYYQFEASKKYWLKGGPNSPENLLAFNGFDNTYRIKTEEREGEAAAVGDIHSFKPHLYDWQEGDPVWRGDKGKALIGAMNYLAEQGMNTVYFLTLNILGDGNDVWPYRTPDDFTRFDVSKLEQWNIVFDHMQSKGILLHIVVQETENELMLDGGDTSALRSLYFSELIARFGHHPTLVWNLGEENGPVHWKPEGQNDVQRMAMATYLKDHDPYGHPVVLHTHSEAADKDDILTPLLGFEAMDGLSFQVSGRRTVNAETQKWRKLSREHSHDWVSTMDEIGMWHTGAMPDFMNPNHDSLRRHALWGHLMGGGAGVEWYFGAHFPSNDLTSEDWRLRENLWKQTRHALSFFETYLPYTEMAPCNGQIIDREDAYCFGKDGVSYALYLPEGGTGTLTGLPDADATYSILWYNPINGGDLQTGSVKSVNGGGRVSLGMPPKQTGADWVALIRTQ
jgi:N-acetylneuraminic acid mutarotase